MTTREERWDAQNPVTGTLKTPRQSKRITHEMHITEWHAVSTYIPNPE
jgi:hypothetical protein